MCIRSEVKNGADAPRRWWRRKSVLIPAVLLTVAIIAAVARLVISTTEPSSGAESVLPFTGLKHPSAVAVDGAGTVSGLTRDSDQALPSQ